MAVELMDRITRATYERELEVALAGSFPASDPLPWTLGAALEAPPRQLPRPRPAATDVVFDPAAAFGYNRLIGVVEGFGLAILIPIGIVLIGLRIVAALRAAVSVVLRLIP
jgi:hypothetical protein